MDTIDGKKIAEEIINNLKSQPKPNKILAAVLIGQNPASISFLKQKTKISQELDVDFRIYNFPEEIKNEDLRNKIIKISNLKKVGGIIIQLPLSEYIDKNYVLGAIPARLDVDVLGTEALGGFYNGVNPILPPSVAVVEEILKSHAPDTNPPKIAIVGLGFLIGRPIANWLMGKCFEIFLLDKCSDLSILKQADVVISGVGQSGLIKPKILKENAIVIDFGVSKDENGKICGDFDTNPLLMSHVALTFTPTPGGTGPILVAKLFENFYKLNSETP